MPITPAPHLLYTDPSGCWSPEISYKQHQIRADPRIYKLLAGPRRATKTIGGLHALMQHAWDCKLGNISMCGRTLTDNFDGGAWVDLTKTIIPQWIEGDFGMEWVTQPKMDGTTHKMYCEVSNSSGGVCRIQLDSVKNEDEVERIYKGKRFSCIYMTEASNFMKRMTLDVMLESLRVIGLEEDEHLFIADTNPAPDGEDSWLYQLWYEFPLMDEEGLTAMILEKNPEATPDFISKQIRGLKLLQKKLSVHEFNIDDNIWYSDDEKAAQFSRYAHNQDLLDRYYYGKWKKAAGDSIFKDVFRPAIHIIGESASMKNKDPEIMIPEENCMELGTGSDLGDANNAVHFAEKTFRTDLVKVKFPDGTWNPELQPKNVSVFKVLDEIIEIGAKLPLSEIVETMEDRMDFWEDTVESELMWMHISDRSAFERYTHVADTYEYKEVYLLSNGRIELRRGPVKKSGSVQQRVDLVRKLLYYDRLLISSRCVKTIEMVNNIKKGRLLAIDSTSIYKHAFDSLTYLLSFWCYDEMQRDLVARTTKNKPTAGLVRVVLR